MFLRSRLFSVRYRKPYWLLICPDTGRTAVYGVDGDLQADQASDALVLFAIENFVEMSLWRDLQGAMRPSGMPHWMAPGTADGCFLLTLRDVDTPTSKITSTPDA